MDVVSGECVGGDLSGLYKVGINLHKVRVHKNVLNYPAQRYVKLRSLAVGIDMTVLQ